MWGTESGDQAPEAWWWAQSILKQMQSQMKGGGPDDYSFPQMLEYYLYRHPMSMLEFYVDDGGVRRQGVGSHQGVR
jgi:hypothetical protein